MGMGRLRVARGHFGLLRPRCLQPAQRHGLNVGGSLQDWATSPLFERKDNKEMALLDLDGKASNLTKRYAAIQDVGLKIQSMLTVRGWESSLGSRLQRVELILAFSISPLPVSEPSPLAFPHARLAPRLCGPPAGPAALFSGCYCRPEVKDPSLAAVQQDLRATRGPPQGRALFQER